MSTETPYMLGHSDPEQHRLMIQSQILRPWTTQYFTVACARA